MYIRDCWFNELTLTDICCICSVHRGGREEAGWEAGEAGSRVMCRVSRARRRHGHVLGLGTRCRGATRVSNSLLSGILPAEKDGNPHGIERATDSGTKEEMLVSDAGLLYGSCEKKQTNKETCVGL